MDFFNKITNKISSGANVVASKTKDIAGSTKISFQISEYEKQIEDLFTQLGKKYYEINGKAASPEYKDFVDKISELHDKIDEAKLELQRIKGITLCENCGAELTKEVKFCPKCGTKVPDPKPVVESVEAAEDKITCPACGHKEDTDVTFCSACGCRLK